MRVNRHVAPEQIRGLRSDANGQLRGGRNAVVKIEAMPGPATPPRRSTSRAVSTAWLKTLDRQRLLETRICDLDLRPEGPLAACLDQLRDELLDRDISFVPTFYLGDDDFWTADRAISINVPWYLANAQLWHLVNTRLCAYTPREVMMYLRHEVGHALGYAFALWKRRDWRATFGDFTRPYEDAYDPNPWSREHVRYLHDTGMYHYAQKHPDEDWAETFAVWLDPKSNWQKQYRSWPGALRKLEYVDTLLSEEQAAAGRPPNTRPGEQIRYTDLEETVAEYLKLRDEVDPLLAAYRRDLREIFASRPARRPSAAGRPDQSAARFIAQHQQLLEQRLEHWLAKISGKSKVPVGVRRSVRRLLRQLQMVSAHEGLVVPAARRRETLVDITLIATRHALTSMPAAGGLQVQLG